MRLPHPGGRGRTGLATALMFCGAVALSAPAAAHPGPVDSSGGHYCTAAQNASNLCAPPTYHRHDESGTQIVVTPGPEAAQLTQANPTQAPAPGAAPTPAPAPAPVAQTPPPAPAPLAHTGPMSWGVAAAGLALGMAGVLAMVAHRRIPLPVVLEFDRPTSR